MTQPYKLTVLAGSNSAESINLQVAKHVANVVKDTADTAVEIEVLDLNDYEMPIYSPARQAAGIPQQAQDFFAKIGASDGLVISLAEYNGSYATAFKNIFDWTSRIEMKMFQNKPMILTATSPGPMGGRNVHAAAMSGFPFYGGNIVAGFQFGPFAEHFDTETQSVTSPEIKAEVAAAAAAMQTALVKDKEAA